MQDGDPFAQYADDADVPEGETEVAFRIRAATEIKGIGNDLYKKARVMHSFMILSLIADSSAFADAASHSTE